LQVTSLHPKFCKRIFLWNVKSTPNYSETLISVGIDTFTLKGMLSICTCWMEDILHLYYTCWMYCTCWMGSVSYLCMVDEIFFPFVCGGQRTFSVNCISNGPQSIWICGEYSPFDICLWPLERCGNLCSPFHLGILSPIGCFPLPPNPIFLKFQFYLNACIRKIASTLVFLIFKFVWQMCMLLIFYQIYLVIHGMDLYTCTSRPPLL
jgi:hypothetical protein